MTDRRWDKPPDILHQENKERWFRDYEERQWKLTLQTFEQNHRLKIQEKFKEEFGTSIIWDLGMDGSVFTKEWERFIPADFKNFLFKNGNYREYKELQEKFIADHHKRYEEFNRVADKMFAWQQFEEKRKKEFDKLEDGRYAEFTESYGK